MPSLSHEALVLLFRNRPELAPELLRDVLGVPLPGYTEVRVESADLTQVAPTGYHADLVLLLVEGRPVLGIVVEIQLGRDERKRFSWPLYAAGLRARFKCDTCVLVSTLKAGVARWAARPIPTGPGNWFQPLVLDPSAIPIVLDPKETAREPELAVLSAVANGGDDPTTAVQIAFAALHACLGLDDSHALLYSDWIRLALGAAARIALEDLMATIENYEFQSEFAKLHDARGRAAGKVEGRVEGKAESILSVLEARQIPLSTEQRAQIIACTDLDVLDRWIRRAAIVPSTDELFP